MKTALAALAALALLATVPAVVQAQSPNGVALTASNAGAIAYAGSGAIPFNVTVGCGDILANPMEDAMVSVTDAPAWFNFTAQEVAVSLADCTDPTTAQATYAGSVPFTVSAAAPAVSLQTVHLTAKLGTVESSNQPGATFTVAYKSSYRLVPSVTFPLTVTNKTTTFTVVGTQASNAPSMIMVDDFSASDAALVSGIGAHQYQNKAGTPQSYTYTVTFTAPEGDWETANTTLKVFGHYNFDGMAGDPVDRMTIQWQFVNGGVDDEHKGGKNSPAPAGAFTALGLLGLAAVLRRKHA